MSAILRLLHPFMPFITEEIWQKLPGTQGSVMTASYPEADESLLNPGAEAEMRLVMETITAIRNLRGEMNVPPATQVSVFLQSADAQALEILSRHRQAFGLLARVRELSGNAPSGPPAAAAKAVVASVEIFLPLAGIIDFSEEERRLAKEMDKLGKDLAAAQRKLSNEDFLSKAPAEVVQKEKDKVAAWTEKLGKLKHHRERIKELME
jgi:valyl-tRNA synthetase